MVLLKVAPYIYFDEVTEKVFEWSKNAYLVLSRWRIFWKSHTWIVFFFLSRLGKNHQILHINWGNTHQKWKLQTPPQFMNRFSYSFVSWISTLCRNLETPSRGQVGSINKKSISISSCHSNKIEFLRESSICSLTL